jgi:hypothetical protein
MAVVTTKSGSVTNRDATPRVLVDSNLAGGRMKEWAGTIETTGTDSAGSKYILCSGVPSSARVSQVLLSCDGNNTNGTVDIGVYKSTADGGAVVDADFFASAQAIGTIQKHLDVTYESGVYGIEDIEKPLWQALGLTSDPNLLYDIVATIVTADDAADTVSLIVRATV